MSLAGQTLFITGGSRGHRPFDGVGIAYLREAGQEDFSKYRIDPEQELEVDIFVDPALAAT